MDVLEFLFLSGYGPEDPVALGAEEELGGGVRDHVRE